MCDKKTSSWWDPEKIGDGRPFDVSPGRSTITRPLSFTSKRALLIWNRLLVGLNHEGRAGTSPSVVPLTHHPPLFRVAMSEIRHTRWWEMHAREELPFGRQLLQFSLADNFYSFPKLKMYRRIVNDIVWRDFDLILLYGWYRTAYYKERVCGKDNKAVAVCEQPVWWCWK